MTYKHKILFLFLILLFSKGYSQKVDIGFTLTPVSMNRLKFDKPAIILNDYYSFDIGKESPSLGYPTLLGLFNSGIYFRYNERLWFLKTEVNYQTKTFRYAHKSYQFTKQFFYYSCIEVPLIAGIHLNPENVFKFKVQAGINIEIGKFNHNSFISPFQFLGLRMNANPAMLDKISNQIYYYHVGFGFDYYGISVDVRCEKNINNINRKNYEFNANFEDLYMIRLALGFKISGRHWDKFLKNSLQLNKE